MSAATCVAFCPSPSSLVGPPAMASTEEEEQQLAAGMGFDANNGRVMIISATSGEDDAAGIDEEEEEHCGSPVRKPRAVVQKFMTERKPFVDGFALRRSIGRPELESLDPFLSLDEFEFSPPAGFGDHPHRGFENFTYILEGSLSYHDFSGHKGTINTGDVQWMTAGRGVVHAEMPCGQGVQRGLNLWINLSAKDKMVAPRYQELASHDIPTVEKDGVSVKVIAGETLGARSPLQTRTPTMCLDVTVRPGARLRQPVPPGWTACAYVIDGEASFGSGDDDAAGAHECVVFGTEGDGLDVRSGGGGDGAPARFLLMAARPHDEAVVMDGPFVMNTREEVEQAKEDYLHRRNGFEMAACWTSDDSAATALH